VFFYGNDDEAKRLILLDEYLSEFNSIPVDSSIAYQSKRLQPTKLTHTFPLSPGSEPKHVLTVNWLLNDVPLNAKDRMILSVLDDLLLGTSSAVLRKTLI
jgi:Zn-dependent M16 (insulinase) family peptidase